MFIILCTFGVGFVNDRRVDANGIDLPIAVTELLNAERRNSEWPIVVRDPFLKNFREPRVSTDDDEHRWRWMLF